MYGENTNYNVLSGHKSAVLEVKWRKKNPSSIVSCSADKTIGIWDSNKGRCIRKLTEHKGIVNTCDVADNDSNLVVSGSDDNTARLWDDRSKWQVSAMQHTYQVTSVAMDSEGSTVYTGGIDNIIRYIICIQFFLLFLGHLFMFIGIFCSLDGGIFVMSANQ